VIADGSSVFKRMSPSQAWANEVEKTPTTSDISGFRSRAMNVKGQTWNVNMYMNSDKAQWKEPLFTTLNSEVGGGKNTRSMQAHVLQYKS